MELLSKDSPAALVTLMQECWRDEASERPQFGNVVEQLALCVGGGGGGDEGQGKDKDKDKDKGGGKVGTKLQAPKASIYTISRNVFQKANVDLAAEGMKRETASEIFKNELAGTLERLFKEVVTQHRLPLPADKSPGLGTYYRAIREAMGTDRSGGSGLFDAPGELEGAMNEQKMMEEFCSQRNLVLHHDVHLPVPAIQQHALTCVKVLDAFKASYPL